MTKRKKVKTKPSREAIARAPGAKLGGMLGRVFGSVFARLYARKLADKTAW